MSQQNLETRWDLTEYLVSLGMNTKEAEAWIKARRKDDSFKTNLSDGVGGHLDKVWRRIQLNAPQSMAIGQLRPIRELREQHILNRVAMLRNLVTILWLYSVASWMYVIAFQFANPYSVYWSLATWLPIRLDYFGEAGFLASFVFAIIWVKMR